jgi:hypothetical protein
MRRGAGARKHTPAAYHPGVEYAKDSPACSLGDGFANRKGCKKGATGRRQICKVVSVLGRGVERWDGRWFLGTSPDGLGVVAVRRSERLVLRLGSQPDQGFGRVLMYADLPEVRAWRACAQLDIAGVFAVRKSEPALSALFSELSTGQEARAVPVSELYV